MLLCFRRLDLTRQGGIGVVLYIYTFRWIEICSLARRVICRRNWHGVIKALHGSSSDIGPRRSRRSNLGEWHELCFITVVPGSIICALRILFCVLWLSVRDNLAASQIRLGEPKKRRIVWYQTVFGLRWNITSWHVELASDRSDDFCNCQDMTNDFMEPSTCLLCAGSDVQICQCSNISTALNTFHFPAWHFLLRPNLNEPPQLPLS